MGHPQETWQGRVAAADESFCTLVRDGVAKWIAGNHFAEIPAYDRYAKVDTTMFVKDALIEALDYDNTYDALAEVLRTSQCPQVAALRERLIRNHFDIHADPVSDLWALEAA